LESLRSSDGAIFLQKTEVTLLFISSYLFIHFWQLRFEMAEKEKDMDSFRGTNGLTGLTSKEELEMCRVIAELMILTNRYVAMEIFKM
jgi:hypothetical protein